MKLIFILAVVFLFQGLLKADDNVIALPIPTVNESISNHQYKHIISRITPQAALVVSKLTGFESDSYSNKTGRAVGATADIGHDDFVLEPGIFYKEMGSNYSISTTNVGVVTGTLATSYVAAPIAGKWYFNGPDASSGFIKFGVVPSVLTSKNLTIDQPFINGIWNLNTFDVAYLVGAGTKIRLAPKTSIMIDATYERGLTNIFSDSSSGGGTYNSSFMLTAGYSFDVE